MVKIRLKRIGAKHRPFYRIVVADSRSPRNGRFIEEVGIFNPIGNKEVRIDEERVKYWLGVGANPTDTVKNLLKKQDIVK